jgi:chemotaxis protein methyltransferase CheR
VTVTPVERFIALIRDETGNVVPPARRAFLAEVLERRSRAAGAGSTAAYVDDLAGGRLPGEWSALVPLVTIKESYFFRAPQQFAALARTLLPPLVRSRAAQRRLTVWSAACARGEEPGTLAILFAENAFLRGWRWEIVGTDVDEEALETARRGLYGERAVAHVPAAQLARWFRPRGKLYELAPELRERITYRSSNLARPPYDLVRDGRTFDLVLLRNVLIYFRRPLQRRVVAAVGQSLAPDGALFLGASETLWQIQERLAAYDLGNCFCYRHRVEGEPEEPLKRLPAEREAAPAAGTAADRDGGDAERVAVVDVPWLDPRGVRRDEEVGATPTSPEPVEGRGPLAEPAVPLAEALAAQPDDDASHLHAQPCGIQERLLGVARRLADGRLDDAHQDLEAVLDADPSEAAAHALDGFLHDLRGEADDAVQAYRAALYLDPALCQVRLLLADLMSRRGWQRRAHHEYREVLAALAAGRDRMLVPFEALPVPDREGAERRCRRALGRSE